MNPVNKLFQSFDSAKLAIVLCSSLLVSCGGGTQTAGIGGTGITSGEITGFGSVFVNGVEFNTDNSQFVVDGDTAVTQLNLAKGMVVTINGSIDANGLTGTADLVVYDDEIEGPVEADPTDVTGSGGSQKLFTIFGQEIVIDQASTSFIGRNFETLAMDDVVEVSGFHAPDSSIHATFVEKIGALPGSTQVELKGTITAFNSSTVSLDVPFSGITIYIDFDTIIDVPGGVLAIGMFVEVEGIYLDATSIDATEIEEEDNDFGENVDEISLQGIVTQSNGIGIFTIGNQLVDASDATITPTGAVVKVGANVEVEGSLVDGTLMADEVELRQGSVELKAVINTVSPGIGEFSLTYSDGPLTVRTDGQTRFEDDNGPDITLSDLMPNDFVVVKGIDISGLVTATNVRRRSIDETEIQGAIEDPAPSPPTITILGISHTVVSGTTQYEIGSVTVTETEFFTGLNNGDIVEIRDNNLSDPLDGIAAEVSR